MNSLRQKCVLLIVDGLGDLPNPDLGGLTPLEAADTPILDQLAAAGRYGLVDPIVAGKTPNTHSGCGLLLGLVPEQIRCLKRGPVEAAGAGRVLRRGEIAVRANFASIEQQGDEFLVTDRRAGRISKGVRRLASGLQDVDLGDGVMATLIPTDQHRAALVMTGDGLSEDVHDTDPGKTPLPARLMPCKARSQTAEFTAAKIDKFLAIAHDRLREHPVNQDRRSEGRPEANGIITRGAGSWFSVDNTFVQKGMRVAIVSGCNTVRGLGNLFGFHTISDPRFTATVDTDLDAKMKAAVEALNSHEFVGVHFKAPDICAHDFQAHAKRDVISRLDRSLEILLKAGCMVALSADHTTDSNTGYHTADPVPALVFRPGDDCDGGNAPEVVKFGEAACRNGTMSRQTGADFLREVIRTMGW